MKCFSKSISRRPRNQDSQLWPRVSGSESDRHTLILSQKSEDPCLVIVWRFIITWDIRSCTILRTIIVRSIIVAVLRARIPARSVRYDWHVLLLFALFLFAVFGILFLEFLCFSPFAIFRVCVSITLRWYKNKKMES